MSKPYIVELSKPGCPQCGHDEQFDIVYVPDQSAQSQSWGDREEVEYIAELLNEAFNRGLFSAKPDWISVEQVSELPPIGVPVLIGNPTWPRSCIGQLKDAATMDWVGYLDQTEQLPEGDPTHWMPLPDLPTPVPVPAAPTSIIEDDDIPF